MILIDISLVLHPLSILTLREFLLITIRAKVDKNGFCDGLAIKILSVPATLVRSVLELDRHYGFRSIALATIDKYSSLIIVSASKNTRQPFATVSALSHPHPTLNLNRYLRFRVAEIPAVTARR